MKLWTYWMKNIITGEIKEFITDGYCGEPGDLYDNYYIIVDYAEYEQHSFV